MRHIGRVVSSDSDQALIQIVRQSACGGNCRTCGGSCCGMGVLISTTNTINARKDEVVYVDSETSKVLKIAAMFYIVPLVVIVAGILISKLFLYPDDTSVLSDVVALIIGAAMYTFSMFLIHLFSREKTISYTISRRQI